jgi:sugar O-acyltransferase (sialic acid O-acetyltransferase NeuD family)
MNNLRTRPLVIFGTGELAEVAAFYFDKDAGRRIAAFTVDGDRLKDDRFCGRPVVALEEVGTAFPASGHDGFVAVGYSRLNALRQEKCMALIAEGYALASYVSSHATVFDDFGVGWNAFILEDNTVQPFVTIGNGVTLWSGNHIGHHSRIGDFVFIASHVVISGGVEVGERCFIGVNATVRDHVSIGARAVIGAGSLVTRDVPDEGVLSAEPARLSSVPSSRLRGI